MDSRRKFTFVARVSNSMCTVTVDDAILRSKVKVKRSTGSRGQDVYICRRGL